MANKYDVLWSEESKKQTDLIIRFLQEKWTEKEVQQFLYLLFHFEKTIMKFPKSFKESTKYKSCRLGLVHPHVTALYSVHKTKIVVLTVFDNRMALNIER